MAVLVDGYGHAFGLAGWGSEAFVFDESGDILQVDPGTGSIHLVAATGIPWWSAAVSTVDAGCWMLGCEGL